MLKKFKKQMKNEKGLTLIELLAVVVILAIIAAIAIPAIGNIIAKQKDKALLADTSLILAGAKLADANGECPAGVCGTDVLKEYVEGNELGTGYTATKTTTTEKVSWSIKFPKLKTHDWKNKPDGLADETITEEDLLKAMGNN